MDGADVATEYGGGGFTPGGKVLDEEMAALSFRPPLIGFGLLDDRPTLLQQGSEVLKREHLPPIVKGEMRWCQGYSEPSAGSDLASLQTRAVVDGDDFVVNGQKIWTSYGDKADWMFLLVRTDSSARKQDGITFSAHGHVDAGRLRQADQVDQRRLTVLRDVLHRRAHPRTHVVGERNRGWASPGRCSVTSAA